MTPLTPWQKHLQACYLEVMAGKRNPEKREFFCLNLGRKGLEEAYNWPERGFYTYLEGVDSDPTAAEVETLIRRHHPEGIITQPKVGALAFWWNKPEGWGHISPVIDYKNDGDLDFAQNTLWRGPIEHGFGGALKIVDYKLQCSVLGNPSTLWFPPDPNTQTQPSSSVQFSLHGAGFVEVAGSRVEQGSVTVNATDASRTFIALTQYAEVEVLEGTVRTSGPQVLIPACIKKKSGATVLSWRNVAGLRVRVGSLTVNALEPGRVWIRG